MSWLDRLVHPRQSRSGKRDVMLAPAQPRSCPHVTLFPRWDSVADVGHEARATSYHCDGCGSDFSPADAAQLRSTEAERIRYNAG